MAVYLVSLVTPHEKAWERIAKTWPGRHYFVAGSETLAFVAPEGISTPDTVKEAVGIDVGDDDPTGLVIRVRPNQSKVVAGVLPRVTVDWVREAADE